MAFFEERFLVGRCAVTIRPRRRQRSFARPYQHFHAERLAEARHHAADAAIAIYAERFAAHAVADVHLPFARLQRGHLLWNLPQRGQDQSPRQFGSPVRRPSRMLARRQDDAFARQRVEVDVRKDTALTHEPQLGQPFDQRRAYRRALADQHQRFGVLQPFSELVGVLGVVVPDGNVVAGELAEARQRADGVMVVVEYRNVHFKIS